MLGRSEIGRLWIMLCGKIFSGAIVVAVVGLLGKLLVASMLACRVARSRTDSSSRAERLGFGFRAPLRRLVSNVRYVGLGLIVLVRLAMRFSFSPSESGLMMPTPSSVLMVIELLRFSYESRIS